MVSSRNMQTATAQELAHVLGAAHVLIVDHEAAILDLVAGVLKRYGATAIEQARSADDALDMVGYTTRPYDLVMLRAGLPDDGAHHVLRVLGRQSARIRVTLHGTADLMGLLDPERYLGIARCIEVTGLPGIVRGAAIVLASNATLSEIFATGIVPTTITVDWAEAIYGALPNRPADRLRIH